jgi:hypothetical protein
MTTVNSIEQVEMTKYSGYQSKPEDPLFPAGEIYFIEFNKAMQN